MTSDAPDKPDIVRTTGGQFAKGHSANPRGRPRGSGELAKLRASIGAQIPHVIEVLTIQALVGDVAAAKLLLERVLPALRPESAAVTMPGLTDAASLAEKGAVVAEAIAAGEIAPDVGATLLTALGALSRLAEMDELERRLAALEADGLV